MVLIRTRPRRRSSICTLSAIPISARPRVAIRCWTSRAQCGVGQAPRCQRAQAGVGRKVLPKPGAMPRARRHFCALPHFRSRCDAHSESARGQSETKNHVCDDGSFPRKQSSGVGGGCTADHCQPGLLVGVGTCSNCGRWGRRPWHLQRAEIVAKRFWVSEEATLIQDQPATRKVDSKICSFRFDCCAQAHPSRLLQQNRPLADRCTAAKNRLEAQALQLTSTRKTRAFAR